MPATRTILDSIRSIVRAIRVSSRASEKKAGLTAAQLFILQGIHQGRGISVGALAEFTHTHQSTASEIVARLVKRKFVRRKPSMKDARRIELSLTASGRKALRSAPKSVQQNLISAIGRMEPEAREQLAQLMSEMTAKAGIQKNRPPLFMEGTT